MKDLVLELSNYQNAILMAVTWSIVEAMTPLSRMIVMAVSGPWRLRLHQFQLWGKSVAGVIWISGLVWIPYAQPPLCEGPPADGCQTPFARVSLAIILGVALSGGHWAGAKLLRKFMGKTKKIKIACANCGTKYGTEDWSDPCPKCNQPPHEVTDPSRAV